MLSKKVLNDIVMPQLAESLVSATVGKWLKQPGDPVEQYEPICEVITDKVNAEIPSTLDGVMGELLVQEGEEIAVGTVICRIETEEAVAPSESVSQAAESVQATSDTSVDSGEAQRARYSPAVQTLAAEHGINLQTVPGTGLGGRVTRKDVLHYIENQGSKAPAPAAVQATPAAQPQVAPVQAVTMPGVIPTAPASEPVRHSGLHLTETPRIPTIEVEGGRSEYLIDVTPIRNTIATRMRQSVSEIPHGWMMIEVDVTNLVQLRNKLKNEFKQKEGINLTYLAFVLKAVVGAIKDYPIMNSVWAVDKIIVKRDIS
ncbi:MAG TPA: 2-oxo acid dehydrogenase subunit E2, partial [Paenibacillus sp.]